MSKEIYFECGDLVTAQFEVKRSVWEIKGTYLILDKAFHMPRNETLLSYPTLVRGEILRMPFARTTMTMGVGWRYEVIDCYTGKHRMNYSEEQYKW